MTDTLQTRIEASPLPGTTMSLAELGARVQVAQSGDSVAISIQLGIPVKRLHQAMYASLEPLLQAQGLRLGRLEDLADVALLAADGRAKLNRHEVAVAITPLACVARPGEAFGVERHPALGEFPIKAGSGFAEKQIEVQLLRRVHLQARASVDALEA